MTKKPSLLMPAIAVLLVASLIFLIPLNSLAATATVELVRGSAGVNSHVFQHNANGQVPEISLLISVDGADDARFQGEWVNEEGVALSEVLDLPRNKPFMLHLPGQAIGYYGLRVSENYASVGIMGQDEGFYHELGIAIMPPLLQQRRHFREDARFGTVFGEALDQRIDGGYVKNATWLQSPGWIADRFAVLANNHKRDILLLYKDGWDSDDQLPITGSQLDTIDRQLTAILSELKDRGLTSLLLWVQLDLEFNAGDWLAKGYGDENLAKKALLVREVLDREGFTHTRTVTHGRGWNDAALEELDRHARVVGPHVDCIGWSLYHHLSGDPYSFPDPNGDDDWYVSSIMGLKGVIARHRDVGAPTCFAILEVGDANHGNHNPAAYWGYDKAYRGPNLLEQAIHRFKFSVIGAAHADLVIDYSYRDRDALTPMNTTEVEAFFGMYGYLPAVGEHHGPPKPAALAYANMRANLDTKEFQSHWRMGALHSYVYGDPDTQERVHVIWTYPYDETTRVTFTALGINPATVIGVQDSFGKEVAYSKYGIEVNRRGLYIRTDGRVLEANFESGCITTSRWDHPVNMVLMRDLC